MVRAGVLRQEVCDKIAGGFCRWHAKANIGLSKYFSPMLQSSLRGNNRELSEQVLVSRASITHGSPLLEIGSPMRSSSTSVLATLPFPHTSPQNMAAMCGRWTILASVATSPSGDEAGTRKSSFDPILKSTTCLNVSVTRLIRPCSRAPSTASTVHQPSSMYPTI